LRQNLPEEAQRSLAAGLYALAQNLPFYHRKNVPEEVEHEKEST
jgi:hypothetical protein